jgi:hypothetical protein
VNAIWTFLSWLLSTAADIAHRVGGLWPWRKPKLYRFIRVEEFPDNFEKTKVYLAGEGENLWAAAMVCPCGCGDIIELNLLKQARPCWSARLHPEGTVSLAPSVWRQKGCQSHFWVRSGRIDWC